MEWGISLNKMLLRNYIKDHKAIIITILAIYLLFICSFFLYRLPLAAVSYPILLVAAGVAFFGALDYRKAKKRYQQFQDLLEYADGLLGELPEVASSDDENYQKIIKLISEDRARLASELDVKYIDLVDYYTVWAHQIKTPIASMRLHLQNEDTPLSRQLTQDLFRIEQYVEMVLTYLRLDSDSTDYVFKEYSLDSIIKETVKKFSGEFIGRKIALSYEPTDATVLTDEKWLSFVVEQIISNALKYTQKGSITIRVEGAAPDNTSTASPALVISDTGIGISPEDLPRIFEKGYTGYNGRSDKKATGIGLYLCKKICGRLGHDITAESVVDQGTTIRIGLKSKGRIHE